MHLFLRCRSVTKFQKMNIQKEVMEGFICPICFQNLCSMVLLHDHFETAHSDEDRALINQIKGPPIPPSFWRVYYGLTKHLTTCIATYIPSFWVWVQSFYLWCITGLFGKAKRKILNQDDGELNEPITKVHYAAQTPQHSSITYEPQELGTFWVMSFLWVTFKLAQFFRSYKKLHWLFQVCQRFQNW